MSIVGIAFGVVALIAFVAGAVTGYVIAAYAPEERR